MKNKDGHDNFMKVFKKYFRKEHVFLLPNILCYIRVLIIPVAMFFYLTPIEIHGNIYGGVYIALALIMIASYSDFIDGYIARTFNQQSDLGKALDPIADKLLQLGIVISLIIKYRQFVSVFVLFGIFILKEATLVVEDVLLARKNKSFGSAKWYGKVASFIFYMSAVVLLFIGPFILADYPYSGSQATEDTIKVMHYFIDSICTFSSIWLIISWVLYFKCFLTIIKSDIIEVSDKESNHD